MTCSSLRRTWTSPRGPLSTPWAPLPALPRSRLLMRSLSDPSSLTHHSGTGLIARGWYASRVPRGLLPCHSLHGRALQYEWTEAAKVAVSLPQIFSISWGGIESGGGPSYVSAVNANLMQAGSVAGTSSSARFNFRCAYLPRRWRLPALPLSLPAGTGMRHFVQLLLIRCRTSRYHVPRMQWGTSSY